MKKKHRKLKLQQKKPYKKMKPKKHNDLGSTKFKKKNELFCLVSILVKIEQTIPCSLLLSFSLLT